MLDKNFIYKIISAIISLAFIALFIVLLPSILLFLGVLILLAIIFVLIIKFMIYKKKIKIDLVYSKDNFESKECKVEENKMKDVTDSVKKE